MELINTMVEGSGLTVGLLELLLKLTIIFAVVALTCIALKSYSANIRRLLWLSAICSAIVLPLTLPVLPSIQLPTVSLFKTAGKAPSPQPVQVELTMATDQTNSASTNIAHNTNAAKQLVITDGGANNYSWISMGLLLALTIWGAGILLFALRLWKNVSRNRLLINNCNVLPPQRLPSKTTTSLIEKFSNTILVSDDIATPLAVGIFRPKVLLPSDSLQWSGERRDAAILHELGHIRNHDNAWRLLVSIVTAIYWFHPLIWYAARKLIEEQEKSADHFVIKQGMSPANYAHSLMEIVKAMRGREHASQLATSMASYNFFPERMRALLKEPTANMAFSTGKTSLLFVVLLIVVTPITLLSTQGRVSDAQDGPLATNANSVPDSNDQMVYDLINQLSLAINERDIATLNSLYADKATIKVWDEEEFGKSGLTKSYLDMFKGLDFLKSTYQNSVSQIDNNSGKITVDGRYDIITLENQTLLVSGNYSFELANFDGRWLLTKDIVAEPDFVSPSLVGEVLSTAFTQLFSLDWKVEKETANNGDINWTWTPAKIKKNKPDPANSSPLDLPKPWSDMNDQLILAINSADINSLLSLHHQDAAYLYKGEEYDAEQILQAHYREFYLDDWHLSSKPISYSANNDKTSIVTRLTLGKKGNSKYSEIFKGNAIAELVEENDQWKVIRIDFGSPELANPNLVIDTIKDVVQGFMNLGESVATIGQQQNNTSSNINSHYSVNQNSPLHTAIMSNNNNIVEMLILNGADVNSADGHGNTPLHLAINIGNADIVEMLLQKGANKNAVNNLGKTPLHSAVALGNEELVEMLIESGVEVNGQ